MQIRKPLLLPIQTPARARTMYARYSRRIINCIGGDAHVMRRITVSLDNALEHALEEAPGRLGIDEDTPDAEKLRAYARIGYEHTLEDELDEARLATYRAWADEPELGTVARVASRRAAARGIYEDV